METQNIFNNDHMVKTPPGLFGQRHSSRDYTKAYYWGKNQFNSSFPASLVAYMHSKQISPVYLKTNKSNSIIHSSITGKDLFQIDPLSDNAYYNYEAGYSLYERYYSGEREKIDLVMVDRSSGLALCGLEVKLTALPDNSTKCLSEEFYGCEIVVRPPTICFLACSICDAFDTINKRNLLKSYLDTVPQINHWDEIGDVAPHYAAIQDAVLRVSQNMCKMQTPLVLQPIWKTNGELMTLAEDCLDVFVWSNLAILQLCCDAPKNTSSGISRFQRTVIWIYRMLFDYAIYGQFDYVRIIKNHSYNNANDKAFAISGSRTQPYMTCSELTSPRIKKSEIKNIILGGGQNLLSPERRFDAMIVNSPELFL